jgi:hypothetical protein
MNKELHDELESIKKGLSEQIPKSDVPAVPETYFHNLTLKVIQRGKEGALDPVKNQEKRLHWEPWFLKITSPSWMTAFGVIALLFIVYNVWFVTPQPENADDALWAEVPTNELESYIDQHIHDIDEGLLVRVLSEEGLKNGLFQDLETEELEGYLLDGSEFPDEDPDQFDM